MGTGTDAEKAFLLSTDLAHLMALSEEATLARFGALVTYSRKVFIPLTHLCRDVCHYCTFAAPPSRTAAPYMTREEVLGIARAGAAAGCREALFTLGDRPEARYRVARSALQASGHASTIEYLRDMARAVLDETDLLPHLNPGLMSGEELAMLRPVAASMGIMLESASPRLSRRGGPHFGSPDKEPARRLATIEAAGHARIPLTTGILIGIGETRSERLDSLLAIRGAQRAHGHIQEVIIQNFRAKPGTKMAGHAEPRLEDHLWTVAAARLILGPEMTIQAPPNLQPAALADLLRAGVNDWGGVSPVTPDHVNPEAPWPHLDALAQATAQAGRVLTERLAVGPDFVRDADLWLDPELAVRIRRSVDARGLPIVEQWRAGTELAVPPAAPPAGVTVASPAVDRVIGRAAMGHRLDEDEIVRLFHADGGDLGRVTEAADALRAERVGDDVTYVVNRNINYTNICLYACGFCAFSKGSTRSSRGAAYRLDMDEVARRVAEAVERGATEVCLQGGIHPQYDGNTYLDVLRAVRTAAPNVHIHAFSPLEVTHGAQTLGLSLAEFLGRLREAGLSTLPGTAAEILEDRIRDIICPDKIMTAQWLEVMRTAHRTGLRSTATIMFGHADDYVSWARHLLAVRDLQAETGGFTEFVPLPFVHMEAPIWRKGRARSGPSWREALLMHAVARLVLHPIIPNIQVSWVKMGEGGVRAALAAGVNDLGGTLMNESISRAAGAAHGQEWTVPRIESVIRSCGRRPVQRTTLYGRPDVGLMPAAEPPAFSSQLIGADA